MKSESSAPARRAVSVTRWVFLSVLLCQLLVFAGGIVVLMLGAGSMNNKFRDVALDRFQWYLASINLEVLLKGYLPVCLVLGVLLLPAVYWMVRKKERPGRWSVFWRTSLLCALITLFLSLRMVYERPYLLDGLGGSHWLLSVRDAIPVFIRERLFPMLAEWLPLVSLVAVVYYYLNALLYRCAPQWPAGTRRMTAFAKLAVLGAACWAIPSWTGRAEVTTRTDKRPNVLIIGSDSLRADHLSCNGYHRVTSPTIDALAKQSINFQKCFTPIASTVESTTTMHTSQYPHTHGLQHMFPNRAQVERVAQKSPKLAQLMRDQGYDTRVMGDWCAGVFEVLPLGFEKVDGTTFDNFKVYMSQAIYMAHPVLPLYFDNPVGYWLFPKMESSAFFVTPEVVTDRAVERLAQQAKSDKPFFWEIFYSCTHIPYTAAGKYGKLFTDPNYEGPHKHQFDFHVDTWIGSTDAGEVWQSMPEKDVAQITGLYDGGVRRFDDCVKRIIDQLKATGQYENTIILVTSDHGDDLFEPNCTFGHGMSFNGGDQNNHIPAVLYVPGKEPLARNVPQITRTLDFAPTILDLCGIPSDPGMEGVSLRPYIETPASDLGLAFFGETSYLFCKRYIPGEEPLHIEPMTSTTFIDETFDCHFVLQDEWQPKVLETKERCLRTERWKFVFTPGKNKDIHRLYDVQSDPHCQKDVGPLYPEVRDAMKRALKKWMVLKQESTVQEIFPPDLFPGGEPAPRPAT
jgi:arylsulfatase A-like enzyme